MFLDILGFKQVVEDSVRQASRAATRRREAAGIYFSLKNIAQSLHYKPAVVRKSGEVVRSSRKVTQFSDAVVVSYLAREAGGLSDMLYDVLHLHLQLVRRGLLVRGAITKGLLHHDDDFVFGPALNEAAELEKVAMYPRVIVDRDLLAEAELIPGKGVPRSPDSLVAQDLDGLYYVDYFAVQPEAFSDDWGEMIEYLITLREHIRKLSSVRQPSVRLKHSWLRHKFNELAEPLEQRRFEWYGSHVVPDDEVDHLYSVAPFR
jgi:hypothetical protein